MFRFQVEGVGIAVCFCAAEILKKTATNPKFKVAQRSHSRQFIRYVMEEKFKSNYDASKGLKTVLETSVLFAKITVEEEPASEASLRIPTVLKIYKAEDVPLREQHKANQLMFELKGFEALETLSKAKIYRGAKRGLDEVKEGQDEGKNGVKVGFACLNQVAF